MMQQHFERGALCYDTLKAVVSHAVFQLGLVAQVCLLSMSHTAYALLISYYHFGITVYPSFTARTIARRWLHHKP